MDRISDHHVLFDGVPVSNSELFNLSVDSHRGVLLIVANTGNAPVRKIETKGNK